MIVPRMRFELLAGFAALALACGRPADRAELAAHVYRISPRGTPIDEAKHLVVDAGFDCDSIRPFTRLGSDTIRAVPCLNQRLNGAAGAMFLLVVQQDRLSDVLVERRE